jgi:hypothetical protein
VSFLPFFIIFGGVVALRDMVEFDYLFFEIFNEDQETAIPLICGKGENFSTITFKFSENRPMKFFKKQS